MRVACKMFCFGTVAMVTDCVQGHGHSGRVTSRDQSGELLAFSCGKQGRRGVARVCVHGEKRPNSYEGHDSDITDPSAHQCSSHS